MSPQSDGNKAFSRRRIPDVAIALAVALAGCDRHAPGAATTSVTAEAESCRACHAGIVESYLETAHFRTSAEAGPGAIAGAFLPGQNELRAGGGRIVFTMAREGDAFTMTGTDLERQLTRTERLSLVIGSGRKGQTYLGWKNGVLLELPVSWLVPVREWINSPGYQDGTMDFDRIVPPRCLECHATSFRIERIGNGARYASDYRLGLSCSKCHGDASRHVAYQTANPADSTAKFVFSPARAGPDQRLAECRVCHGGPLEIRKPPFSFQPGMSFDEFYREPAAAPGAVADVHGNQIALLAGTKCFAKSPGMTCSTCHDVHRTERDLTTLGAKCLGCHTETGHRRVAGFTAGAPAGCIDCHMPNRPSEGLKLTTPGTQQGIYYRSHAIAIYPRTDGRTPTTASSSGSAGPTSATALPAGSGGRAAPSSGRSARGRSDKRPREADQPPASASSERPSASRVSQRPRVITPEMLSRFARSTRGSRSRRRRSARFPTATVPNSASLPRHFAAVTVADSSTP